VAREQKLSAEERLRFHQQHSGPLMKTLQQNPSAWMPWNYQDTLARLATSAAA